jgi:hypothetical protein
LRSYCIANPLFLVSPIEEPAAAPSKGLKAVPLGVPERGRRVRGGWGASLYRNSDLRSVVEEYRVASNDPRTLSRLKPEIAHLRKAVAALAEKVRKHETELPGLAATQSSRRKAN